MNTERPFYMVFLEGGNTPSYRHETLESAEKEAKRLSELHKRKAYVLCTIKSIKYTAYDEVDLRPENLLPF